MRLALEFTLGLTLYVYTGGHRLALNRPYRAADPDNWQRDRQCAAQAELVNGRREGVRAEYEAATRQYADDVSVARRLKAFVDTARSGKAVSAAPIEIEKAFVNHYSPKYGKCSVKFIYVASNAQDAFERTSSILLMDAFEEPTRRYLNAHILLLGCG